MNMNNNKVYYVALTGNPNVGKSALFNDLTGGEVYVANWPGVTVELKYGNLMHHGLNIKLIDLPGSYSLVMGDEAEKIVRDFILNNKPDLYIVITDITALERTLYPAIKLLEAYSNVLIVLNMVDIAKRRALHVDVKALERELNTYLVETSALTGEGIGVLLDRITDYLTGRKRRKPLVINYGPLEPYIHKLEEHIKSVMPELQVSHRWVAIELLEGDEELRQIIIKKYMLDSNLVHSIINEASNNLKIDIALHIIRIRYNFISNLLKGKVLETKLIRPKWMERLDAIFLKPYIGTIFSLFILFIGFLTIFIINTGFPLNIIFGYLGMEEIAILIENYSLVELIGLLINFVSESLQIWLSNIGIPQIYVLFITDGIITGVGAVLSFIPLVFLVFILNAFLQDTGLYTRIAVSLHDLLRRFGLSGKSIYPVVVGFGCNVPAVLSTRALDDDRERVAVSLSIPFIPCQARLVVLLAIVSAITKNPIVQAAILISLYILSIMLYLITIKLLTLKMFKMREGPELLMELPPYHFPHFKVLWWFSKFHTMAFLRKAGTIILILSIVMWILLHFSPTGYITPDMIVKNPDIISNSFAAGIGKLLLPIASTIGLGDWRAVLALEVGFIAKEGVISTIATITGFDDPISAFNAISLSTLQLYILAIFMLIYTPCLPTVVSIKGESGRWKYVLMIIGYELVLAYIIALIFYQLLSIFLI